MGGRRGGICGKLLIFQCLSPMTMTSKLESKIGRLDIKLSRETRSQLTSQSQVTLEKNYYVEAQMKQSDRWFKARILDYRLSKDYEATKTKDESSYNYYVHFEDVDKRHDDWIPFHRIRSTTQRIDDIEVEDSKQLHPNDNPHFSMTPGQLILHQEITKFKTIYRIQLGKHQADAWYFSPYPPFYHNLDCLYICEFCLSFYAHESELKRHTLTCPLTHPPGDEIYRDEEAKVAVFEIDGFKNSVYCENLALMAKLFLDHKTLVDDMSIFLFYILCEIENNQYHIAGYFSKIKVSENNLSCILVLPFHQRKGFGKFLITFSYELSQIQQKVGGPEKPLSDLGRQTYLSWWTQRIIQFIRENKNESFSLADISKRTSMTEEDIKWTMEKIKVIKISAGQPYLCTDEKYLNEAYKNAGKPGIRVLTKNIHWVPFRIKWDSNSLYM